MLGSFIHSKTPVYKGQDDWVKTETFKYICKRSINVIVRVIKRISIKLARVRKVKYEARLKLIKDDDKLLRMIYHPSSHGECDHRHEYVEN